MGLNAKKNCLRGFENNKGADQPAHPQSDQHICYSLFGNIPKTGFVASRLNLLAVNILTISTRYLRAEKHNYYFGLYLPESISNLLT